ncbi:MAG: hypothetical protein M1834_000709 [Cirrosporium novae-zelandiae]|nr:MAG: hypothetical protein M1834_000709 [Cirrosporium novae-zelandiae]
MYDNHVTAFNPANLPATFDDPPRRPRRSANRSPRRRSCLLPQRLQTILEDEEVNPPQDHVSSLRPSKDANNDPTWRLITENPIFHKIVTDELKRRDVTDARIGQLASQSQRSRVQAAEVQRRLDWAKKIVLAYPIETGALFERMAAQASGLQVGIMA